MAETVSEPLNNVVLPQQIMATDQSPTPTTASCVATTIDSLPATTDTLNNYKSENLPQEITTSVESMSSSETISVSTQVNIIAGHQPETNEFTNQQILQSPTMAEKNIVQDSEAVTLPANAITMSAEGTIVSNSQGELIEIVPVASLSTMSPIPALNPNLPTWAGRLRDCELIGDSYRGYVTNEVELDLILTLHKQQTNSCWGTRQSPSSAKPSIRLMWKSQYVPYDGIPFLNTGRRATVMECQYGPRRKGNVSKKSTDFDSQGNALKKAHRPTCPARIYIKKVKKFPEYRIDLDLNLEGKNVRQAQERALTHLRLAGVETGGEERFYVQLPLPIAHEYHDVEDITITQSPDSRGQRLNQQVADKIHEFVARGITGVYAIKHCLKEYVEKELYTGQDPPPRHNKAFFPTIIDLQNHIHEAQAALASGQLLPLPPLSNPPLIPSPPKERVRKRKQPMKHSQTSQTINRLQTAEAVASIQELDDQHSPEENREDVKQENDQQLQEHLAQFGESESQPLVITHGQADPTKNGQVVIVVTSNNVFTTGQEAEPPTTFAQISLPSSHITNLPSSSFGTLPTGSQAVLITHPQGENGQFLAQTQHSNILTVMNPTIQGIGPNQRVVLRMVPTTGNIQPATTVDSQTDPSAPEQLLASQAAVAAVLNAAATVEESNEDQEKDTDCEPAVKRQAVGIDLSSLVKEAGFDSHHVQVSGVEMTTVESTQPILTSTDSTANPQDYTDNGTETTLVEYTYQNNTKQNNQEETLPDQQSVMDSYDVLDDTQSTHQATVDTSEIQSISMDAELIENFPKFTGTSEARLVHVTSADSNGTDVGTGGMVLVTDAINSYHSHTDNNVENNTDLNTKELDDTQ